LRPLTLCLALAFLLAACGGSAQPARDPLAGVYSVGGGDAALPNVRALTDAFVARHPGVRFEFDTTLGSEAAVNLVADRTLHLGMASRELAPAESLLVDRVLVGAAGTGLVLHQNNSVKDLTTAQVQSIYGSRITDWSAVGGASLPVIPLIREKGSSARATFETVFFGGKAAYGATVLEVNGGDQIRWSVAGQSGAIGTIGVTTDDPEGPGIHLVSIDGVLPTKQALRDGTYKLRRPLYVLVPRVGEIKPAIASFIEFVRGPEGQKVIDRF